MKIFKLPDLGEGLPDAEVVEWHVKEGDTVAVDQLLVSMETAKAVVEVPSPYAGIIMKLHGKKGDVINTGLPLVSFDGEEAPRKDTGTVVGKVEVGDVVVKEMPTSIGGGSQIKVLPAVRAIAKKMNVDLSTVQATGPDGMITKEDVERAKSSAQSMGPMEALSGVRKAMSSAMQGSHAVVVPVTLFDDADITQWKTKDFTARLVKAICYACAKEPSLNAWFDGKTVSRRLFDDCHIGLAMDTEQGLFVPVIEKAQNKDSALLRSEIEVLKKDVKARTIKPERLRGNTITLSNFGNFAGRYATPIVVPPSVAIIAVGKVREEVKAIQGDPMVRTILPLSLTFDHRAVTGGEATRFLGYLIENLSAP